MLFDKLERSNSKVGELIKKTFGGSFVNQMMSMESDYCSERPEPFNMITLTVKNKASLEESLEGLISADLLTGDNKFQLPDGSKVDAKKRQVLRDLPPHLILHLKRFEFDLDTLRKNKVCVCVCVCVCVLVWVSVRGFYRSTTTWLFPMIWI